ncbi:MAG TPA: hypothetical protein VHR84_20350, partial [Terriglobales bacterium]|nr:hypothetical protein [Terriglobales bacterium]
VVKHVSLIINRHLEDPRSWIAHWPSGEKRRLQQEGILRIVPNKGYFVSHNTIDDLNEMYEYRTELEGFCAELAARRWTDQPFWKSSVN